MQQQGSFSQAEYAGKKRPTRRGRFLAEMEGVVPWARLVDRLRPFYPKGERGRPPVGLERMLELAAGHTIVGNRIRISADCRARFKGLVALLDSQSVPTSARTVRQMDGVNEVIELLQDYGIGGF